MAEQALLLNSLCNREQLSLSSRLYLGVEYCPHLMPESEQLLKAHHYCKINQKQLTLVTPICFEIVSEQLQSLIKSYAELEEHLEIVVNDWGVFHFVVTNFPHLQPIIGRLLTRQKRFSQKLSLGENEAKHFSSLPLAHPAILEWLTSKGVRRFELEVEKGLDLTRLIETNISLSLYLPYSIVSVTRACPASYHPRFGWQNYRSCAKRCLENFVVLDNEELERPLISKGSAVLSDSESFDAAALVADRLVLWPQNFEC